VYTWFGAGSLAWMIALWVVLALLVVLNIDAVRMRFISRPFLRTYRRMLPSMSQTEKDALEAGTVWWDGELFTGAPDWEKLMSAAVPRLTAEEQAFIDGPCEELCAMVDDWDVTHRRADLSPHVWDYVKTRGFFAMIIPKKYGGLEKTVWTEGMRVARDVVGTPIKPEELQVGDLVNAEPIALFEVDEHGQHVMDGHEVLVAKSKAAVILLRMEPQDITPGRGRENWTVQGIVAYSKICTHVGCPISLNERTTHHLLCPCHQSTFDLADSGRVVFGPAARALPQLPLAVDSEGYLVAQSDFTEPVGPSYWERG
jgi:arsenite oxidase small subunit